MIGLSFWAGFIVYVFISAIVINIVSGMAIKRGRSPKKWGLAAALVMYHLVFWDFIPTWVVYKYYCATKAGFWVYKAPEQWKAENPGVPEMLTWQDISPDYKEPGVIDGYQLNERIVWIIKRTENLIVPVGFTERLIVDVKNNETLVKRISVGTGYDGGKGFIKFWTKWPTHDPNRKEFYSLKNEYKELGSKAN